MALTILSMLLTIGYSALSGIVSGKILLDDGREAQAIANSLIARLTRELQLADAKSALLPEPDDIKNLNPDTINMHGINQKLNNHDADSLSFMARGASQYVMGGANIAHVVNITYRVANNPDAQDPDNDPFVLVREETPNIRPLENAFARSMVFPLSDRVVSLNFRYFGSPDPDVDIDEWRNDWDKSKITGLPKMIEFSLKIMSPAGKIRTFTTAVPIRGRG